MRRLLGGSGGGHNAATSPGFDATKLSGDKLELMKLLAEKAATTYPPAFTGKPFEHKKSEKKTCSKRC